MIVETINAIAQAHAALAQASPHFVQAVTTTGTAPAPNLPNGFSNTPSSVAGMVNGIKGSIDTASDAAPIVLGGAGGAIAGIHAVAKAGTTDPQKIQHHSQGIKNGIVGGLVGIGGGSIITIIAHIL